LFHGELSRRLARSQPYLSRSVAIGRASKIASARRMRLLEAPASLFLYRRSSPPDLRCLMRSLAGHRHCLQCGKSPAFRTRGHDEQIQCSEQWRGSSRWPGRIRRSFAGISFWRSPLPLESSSDSASGLKQASGCDGDILPFFTSERSQVTDYKIVRFQIPDSSC